ncbi:D-arabitol-phosphate dehydrogenase [Paenibacillus allorhizoplanae]|uniref:D-arabitol-phosphate dehydrogenase n=1 Tax=Paenibacillus allorhizoplanae TaxID=2905648 RepID=A0ABM9CSD7_9BACL|nr:zinc-binding alcohol dehydrogenase [Paenibacillus allorhizoplanae]CAH1221979.1 D-arabitol-phosphate dehydrogenase [Paenibacillus allorhizoplanae]
MRAVIAREGSVEIIDLEEPAVEANYVLVETAYSAISPGTEMMLKDIRSHEPISLGYSAMGQVKEVGAGISHVKKGDRVACYGSPFVRHAELLKVPKHLVAPLPEQVDAQEAAHVGLGTIAIHALRQADLRFGESVLVVGLGILGQIVCQVAQASANIVIGIDRVAERTEKLTASGVRYVFDQEEDMMRNLSDITGGAGVDAVILCVGGGNSEMIDKALGWIRDKGKLIIVGDVSMVFNRELMFQKEAQILISRAGGPGRYLGDYEKKGIDYPIGLVRWTEGRNMAEYIRLLTERKLSIAPLISHILPLERIGEAYDLYRKAPQQVLGVVVRYGDSSNEC